MPSSNIHTGAQTTGTTSGSHTKAGGVVGRVMDALSGQNRTHRVDWDRENAYWRDNFKNERSIPSGRSYEDYAPAYRTGYEGYCSCEPGTRFEDIESTLQQNYTASNASLPWTEARTAAQSAWLRAERGEAFTVPLSEEELAISKREVEAGAAKIKKVVHTETVTKPVELRREEAVIERVAPTTTQVPANAFQEGTIEVPLKREEAVVEKTAHVVGEVKVKKNQLSETQNVQEKLRKEDVIIEKEGRTEIHRDDIHKK